MQTACSTCSPTSSCARDDARDDAMCSPASSRDASLGTDARDDARMPLTLALGTHHRSQVSSSCLDFVQKLLEPDQQRRMTIEEAMRHTWLRSNS